MYSTPRRGSGLDYEVKTGNPPDAEQLAPAISVSTTRLGRTPEQVAADRGYGEASVDKELEELGVETVVIPRKGKPGKARQDVEHSPEFRDLVKWRTGCEGRISHLKRRYGWDRSLVLGANAPQPGAATGFWPTTSSRSPAWRPRPSVDADSYALDPCPACG